MRYLSTVHLGESPSFPPKPVDPDGRYVAWVLVTSEGVIHYEGQKIAVDDRFLSERVRQHRLLSEDGYAPPVLAEHTADGERRGDILDVRQHTYKGKPALIAAVAFADVDAEDKIRRGAIKYVSPGFKSFTDDKGRDFRFVLAELSLVSAPHQKRLGETHILASEGATMLDKEMGAGVEVEGDKPSPEERLAALERRIVEIGEAVAKVSSALEMMETMPDEDEGEPDDKKSEDEDPKESAMAQRVAKLEAELSEARLNRRRAEFDAAYPVGGNLEITEALRDALFAVSETAPEAFATIKRNVSLAETPAKPPRRSEIVPWGAAMSEGVPSTGEPKSDDELLASLRAQHNTAGEALAAFKQIKGA